MATPMIIPPTEIIKRVFTGREYEEIYYTESQVERENGCGLMHYLMHWDRPTQREK